jgi:hypothetical protein
MSKFVTLSIRRESNTPSDFLIFVNEIENEVRAYLGTSTSPKVASNMGSTTIVGSRIIRRKIT